MQVQVVLLEHLWISLVPWLLGGLVGGGLGYGLVLALRGLASAHPSLRRVAVLLPWRLSPWSAHICSYSMGPAKQPGW